MTNEELQAENDRLRTRLADWETWSKRALPTITTMCMMAQIAGPPLGEIKGLPFDRQLWSLNTLGGEASRTEIH